MHGDENFFIGTAFCLLPSGFLNAVSLAREIAIMALFTNSFLYIIDSDEGAIADSRLKV
ncbi:hypothetical protein I8752_34280 [Nostocaceae cyanobacterium CENA369]|uniref:Uncharacterized protein n=1 Tax=Dendronalium phyllosphericum CENA369 TaxID=1725256 RepID=A0A8J7IG56_9NOST|nr:hypothetical protein [Dendronalium phyllosphericum]MBH8577943.1 hypothetical protein [Dendronalium phyllosphericum CENA369]